MERDVHWNRSEETLSVEVEVLVEPRVLCCRKREERESKTLVGFRSVVVQKISSPCQANSEQGIGHHRVNNF